MCHSESSSALHTLWGLYVWVCYHLSPHFQTQPHRETGPEERGQGHLQTHVRPALYQIYLYRRKRRDWCGVGVRRGEICEIRWEWKRKEQRKEEDAALFLSASLFPALINLCCVSQVVWRIRLGRTSEGHIDSATNTKREQHQRTLYTGPTESLSIQLILKHITDRFIKWCICPVEITVTFLQVPSVSDHGGSSLPAETPTEAVALDDSGCDIDFWFVPWWYGWCKLEKNWTLLFILH